MSLEEPEPQSDAEKLAASNAAANTTKTQNVKLLNSSPILTIWSYHQCTVWYTSTAKVLDIVWRASNPYKTSQGIDKALLAILPVWFLFSPNILYSPTTPFEVLIDIVSTINKKIAAWTKSCLWHLYKIFISLSRTSPEVFGSAWTTKGNLLSSPTAVVWAAANSILGLSWVVVVKTNSTTKSNLQQTKKMQKGRALTFSPKCVSHKNSGR